jgi:hypothetical protein
VKQTTSKRVLTLLGLALALRRHHRRAKRGVRILRRGLLVLAFVAGVVVAVVWNKRRGVRFEEVPSGQKPIEGVGTQTAG